MTLEEKAAMCSGADFWHTEAVKRLGIPTSMVSDGPHGLRKQSDEADHLGLNDSIKAVCFPAGCGTAASFNRDLITMMGETLGNECQAENLSVILGPAVNIKRSPLCGRNFEYYSEDPLVATEIAGALIKGIQSKNVGTSIKHFLANNQETRRMSSSSEVDERTLREIYLAAFEGAITKQKPWTVMCSYNKINGVYAAENKTYLTDVLRDEWNFDGYVMSDWGAVNSRVADLKAGMDLEMPSSFGINDALIVEALKKGTLDENIVDQAIERILNIVYLFDENRDLTAVFDRDKDHEVARH
ncbi:MAG: glycoside hydrolase family 3 N-terminal domain-containing protein, partial [Mobilitalea sp.]